MVYFLYYILLWSIYCFVNCNITFRRLSFLLLKMLYIKWKCILCHENNSYRFIINNTKILMYVKSCNIPRNLVKFELQILGIFQEHFSAILKSSRSDNMYWKRVVFYSKLLARQDSVIWCFDLIDFCVF